MPPVSLASAAPYTPITDRRRPPTRTPMVSRHVMGRGPALVRSTRKQDAAPLPTPGPAAGTRARVFVVEDDALVALALMERLRLLGYEPCGHAVRSEVALSVVPHLRPDVVVMDVNLGDGPNGVETTRRLLREVDVAVVFVTAYSDPELVAEAVGAGAFGFVRKPYHDADIRIAIEVALGRHADRASQRPVDRAAQPGAAWPAAPAAVDAAGGIAARLGAEDGVPSVAGAVPLLQVSPPVADAAAGHGAPMTGADSREDSDTDAARESGDEDALREARSRFIAGFRRRCGRLGDAVRHMEVRGVDEASMMAVRHTARRLATVATTVGMSAVGEHASSLEALLDRKDARVQAADLRRAIDGLSGAFSRDLASVPPGWAAASGLAVGAHVLVAVHDTALGAALQASLRGGGYSATWVRTTDEAWAQVTRHRPSIVLLDGDLPGASDGYGLCRRIKADPDVSGTPVVLVTATVSSVERLTALALGADDVLAKPVEPVEMLLRVRWMLVKPDEGMPNVGSGSVLGADDFLVAARRIVAAGPASLVLVRVNPGQASDVGALFIEDLRRKDLVGRYSETQLALLLPGASAAVADRRVAAVLTQASVAGATDLAAGVVATGHELQPLIEPMLAQAEAALAAAQVHGRDIVVYGNGTSPAQAVVLIADDDPDVVQVIDARLRAAGYGTVIAFDGQQALQVIETSTLTAVLLDLGMPKKTGFDVLAALRHREAPRPRVIVISGRTREEDITRAFDLGADDYVTKPFSPQELLARLSRLVLQPSAIAS